LKEFRFELNIEGIPLILYELMERSDSTNIQYSIFNPYVIPQIFNLQYSIYNIQSIKESCGEKI